MTRGVLLSAFVALVGCSGGDFETAATGGEDSAVVDSSSIDATEGDTELDSTVDSGTTDSATGSHVDAPPPLDTGVPGDTGGGMLDTGSGLPDVAGGCPAPISMAPPIDVSTWNCDQLKAAYPMKVDEAKACGCEADCSQEVPRDFCGCTTIVSPAAPAYPSLEPMRKRWMDLGCTIICPKVACKMPVLAGCFPSGVASAGTVCTTM